LTRKSPFASQGDVLLENAGNAARVRGEKMSDYAQTLTAQPIADWRRLWAAAFMRNELRAGYL